MAILDHPDPTPQMKADLMANLMESFPDQMREAAGMLTSLSLPRWAEVRNVVVTGMGGSAIGGDLVRAAVSSCLHIPLLVNRDYVLPEFTDAHTLVIASSYSGDTEETLQAYDEARRRGTSIVCITSGGQLASHAASNGVALAVIPGGLPPRAALGYSSVMILGILSAAGLIPDITDPLQETIGLLAVLARRYGSAVEEPENTAKIIARSLHGKLGAIYAAGRLLEAAAFRWRCQIEENAKNLAWHHVLPEMNHNELVGWDLPRDLLRQIVVVLLRDCAEPPGDRLRFDLTRDIVRDRCGVMHEVRSEGTSALARIFSLVYLGDFVSLYLARLNAVDPVPIAVIDYLKAQLRNRAARAPAQPTPEADPPEASGCR